MTINSVAIYCRISRDDGNIDESESIKSQKEILTSFVNEKGWNIFDYYIDDGYSGTNFNRPSFKKLINDIEQGVINTVITKDLSRLGRNYIQTGYYTEDYFPSHNIRYIAVNDNFDTFNEVNSDFIPFKNIINEWYAKDISKKIKFTLDNKAKKGDARNTVFPIFGYKYNEKYERIPDEVTSKIVKMIFKEYIRLGSSIEVAKLLKDNKIKIPSFYNAINYGYNKNKILNYSADKLITWSPEVIRDIIKKKEYLGTYTTSKTISKSYKSKKRTINVNPYIFENRYEPIIDKDTFIKANRILNRTRSGSVSLKINEYKGLIICNDCHKFMKYDRKKDKTNKEFNYYRYYCSNKCCQYNSSIQKKYLDIILTKELVVIINILLSDKEMLKKIINKYTEKRTNKIDLSSGLALYKKKLHEIDNNMIKLFEMLSKNIIPESTFKMMINNYNNEKSLINEEMNNLSLNINLKQEDNKNDVLSKTIDFLSSLNENNILTSELIHSVINNISISSRKIIDCKRKYNYNIVITYNKLDDELKELININE